jgi:adenine-specific DNA-methyltransferase
VVNKVKNLGQIYTPLHIVNDMLDFIDYNGETILQKHIIDNSCGNGAFLSAVADRYIKEYKNKHGRLDGVKREIETYIHGIEIDPKEYQACLDNLDGEMTWQGITNIKWDIVNGDTLQTTAFDGKMDFVVANPPYVRVHNLGGHFETVREYKLAQDGMTDLFLVFYEIGFNMLNQNGKLCYITPNSFYSSVAGQSFRNYILQTKSLFRVCDLGHYQPFKATTYTTICVFHNNKQYESIEYEKYNNQGERVFQESLNLHEAFNNGKMILAKQREQAILKNIQNYTPKDKTAVQVKNAFATLGDDYFIQNNFNFESKYIIDCLKASTGEWKKCIFPYDKDIKAERFEAFEKPLQEYFLSNKDNLQKRSLDKGAEWFAFGRSQAINDIYKDKIAVNTTIKDIKSIKLNNVKNGQGVYSGLYILTEEPFAKIKEYIENDEFIEYIKTIGKCKSGGYYTFSSNDLYRYLIYKKENTNG